MKELTSPTGYKVIEITRLEATAIDFGNMCDRCGFITNENMYYVAALNKLMCKDCYDSYISTFPRYNDYRTIEFENRHYADVLNRLKEARNFECSMLVSPV